MNNSPQNIINKIIDSRVEDNTLYLYLYGYLGEGEDRISFQDVFSKVNDVINQATKVIVKLNSGGGCLYTGLAIMDYLKNYKEKVSVHIEGLAASAASFIALAGNETLMSPTSKFMIHNPRIPKIEMETGEAKEFRLIADSLAKDENMMVNIYKEKTNLDFNLIKSMMDETTEMFASEAIEKGFVDGVTLTSKLLPMNYMEENESLNQLHQINLQKEYEKMKQKLKITDAMVKTIANELGIEEEKVEEVAAKIEAIDEPVKEEEKTEAEVSEEIEEIKEEVEEEVKAEAIDKAQLIELIATLTSEDGMINAEELISALNTPSPEAFYKKMYLAMKKNSVKNKVAAKKEMAILNSVADSNPTKVNPLSAGWLSSKLPS